jgi:hypothetical protein
MNNDQNNLGNWIPTVLLWGSAYFLFTHGYKKTALTMGAIGLAAPIVLFGGGLLYLKSKGYFGQSSQPKGLDQTASNSSINSPDGYVNAMLQVT